MYNSAARWHLLTNFLKVPPVRIHCILSSPFDATGYCSWTKPVSLGVGDVGRSYYSLDIYVHVSWYSVYYSFNSPTWRSFEVKSSTKNLRECNIGGI